MQEKPGDKPESPLGEQELQYSKEQEGQASEEPQKSSDGGTKGEEWGESAHAMEDRGPEDQIPDTQVDTTTAPDASTSPADFSAVDPFESDEFNDGLMINPTTGLPVNASGAGIDFHSEVERAVGQGSDDDFSGFHSFDSLPEGSPYNAGFEVMEPAMMPSPDMMPNDFNFQFDSSSNPDASNFMFDSRYSPSNFDMMGPASGFMPSEFEQGHHPAFTGPGFDAFDSSGPGPGNFMPDGFGEGRPAFADPGFDAFNSSGPDPGFGPSFDSSDLSSGFMLPGFEQGDTSNVGPSFAPSGFGPSGPGAGFVPPGFDTSGKGFEFTPQGFDGSGRDSGPSGNFVEIFKGPEANFNDGFNPFNVSNRANYDSSGPGSFEDQYAYNTINTYNNVGAYNGRGNYQNTFNDLHFNLSGPVDGGYYYYDDPNTTIIEDYFYEDSYIPLEEEVQEDNSGSGSDNPPLIDLDADNSSGVLGRDYTTSYTKGSGASSIVDSDLSVSSSSNSLSGAVVTIINLQDSGQEILSVDTSGTNITVNYDSNSGALTLSGVDSVTNYQNVLRTITYNNTSDSPTLDQRTIEFVVSDGTSNSTLATSTVNISEINDAPVLTPSAPSLISINEDQTGAGETVGTIAGSSISDTNTSALKGIAIYATSGNGLWEYSLDGKDNWNSVGSVTSNNALLLKASDQVRYVGDGQSGETASFDYYAWDQTSGTTGTKVDATTRGGTTAFSSANDTASITVTAVNDAPVNSVPDSQATIEETDLVFSSGNNNALSINDVDAASDSVQVTLSVSNGVLTLSGVTGLNFSSGDGTEDASMTFGGTINAINTALEGLTYAPDTNFTGNDTLQIITNDQGNNGGSAKSDTDNIGIAVADGDNDAPVLTPAAPSLAAITEDQTGSTTVSNFVGSSITDPDSGASEGIAIYATSGNGTWEYNTGSGWASVGSVGTNSALLLRSTDQIRYTGDSENAETATFDYYAWDQTSGTTGTKVDATTRGGTTAFSSANDTASITVTAVNDAPTLNAASPSLTSITEDQTGSGETVTSIVDSTISDIDSSAVEGIAIYGTSGNGTWEYNTGSGWASVGSVGANNALLLASDDQIRYTGDGENAETATFDYYAWDQTSGSAGSKVDVSSRGGATAFSSTSDTASISVTAVNDAPTLTSESPTITSITEDQTSSSFSIGNINDSISDVDTGTNEIGMAVYGTTGNGTWQYYSWLGTWENVGTVSEGSALLLKEPTNGLRYVGDSENGETATLSYYGWDQSVGNGETKVDVSTRGGTTAFSTASDTLSITVTAVNDAPTLNAASPSLTSITEDQTGSGETVTSIVDSTISDIDSSAVEGIAIYGTSGNGTWEYNTGSGWASVGSVGANNALLLASDDQIRYTGDGENAETATFDYYAWDQTSGSAGSKVDVSSRGDATAFSSASDTASISVTAVNDAPTISNLNGEGATFIEDSTGAVPLDNNSDASISDVDDSDYNGGYLDVANTNGTSNDTLSIAEADGITLSSSEVRYNGNAIGDIDATHDGASGANLRINFDTANADDTAVGALMQAIRFNNSSDAPNTTSRVIRFTVNDGTNTSSNNDVTVAVIGNDNDAPTISNLGGDNPIFTAGGSAVALDASSDATIADVDDTNLESATITITNLQDGASESLAATTSGTNITANYDSGTGVLTLSGTDTLSNYQTVLRSITYDNSADPPDTTTRTVRITLNDGTNTSSNYDVSVTVNDANAAPTLTAASPTLTSVTEDETGSGETVSSIVGSSISDSDAGAVEGIAVYSTSSSGTWQYNIGNGWVNFGSVATGSALLLRETDQVRFVGDTQNGETATFSYYAWDQTSGSAGDKVDVSTRGDTTAFSSTGDTASITVTDVNDAPTVNSGQSFSIAEDAANSASVGTVTGNDVDTGDSLSNYQIVSGNGDGIFAINSSTGEITITDNSNLDYETTSSYNLGVSVSDGTATSSTESVTVNISDANIEPTIALYTPDTTLDFNATGAAEVTSYAMPTTALTMEMWVQADFASGANVLEYKVNGDIQFDIRSTGEYYRFHGSVTTKFGLVMDDGNWHHLAVSWDTSIGEFNMYQDGQLVQTIDDLELSKATTALTSGGTLTLGNNAAGNSFGLEGSMRDVRIWSDIRTQSEIESNMFNTLTGGESNLTSLWLMDDGSSNTVTDSAGSADLTLSGGVSWSTNVAAQDLPVIFNEGNGAVNVIHSSEHIVVGDPDSSNLSSATITISNLQDGTSESLAATTTGTNISASYDSGTGVLSLTGSDTLANYQQVINSITYNNTASTPDTTTRTLSISLNSGTDASVSDFTQDIYMRPTLNTSSQTFSSISEDSSNADVSGIQVTHADATNVQIFLKVDNGTLNMTTTTGLTFVDGSSNNSGWMNFHGTLTNVNNALATLQYTPDADFVGTETIESHVLGFQNSNVNTIGNIHYNSDNGHFYEVVADMSTWDEAKLAAEGRSLDGMGGYLTTITSSTEDDFLINTDWGITEEEKFSVWLGGNDVDSEGNFVWVTGPEGEANGGAGTAFSYENWWSNFAEPSTVTNANYVNYFLMSPSTDEVGWAVDAGSMSKYFVEYGGLSTDSLLETADITVTNSPDDPTDISISSSNVAESTDTSSAYTIGALSTTDPDAGDSHTYSIIGGADQADFQISDSDLQFKAGTSLDYETKTSYQVTIRTTDSTSRTYDETLTINITDVSDAPVLTAASPTLSSITEDQTSSDTLVSTVVGTSITDADSGAVEGIAIYATSGNGTWEYNTGGGWTSVGSVASNNALLLAADDQIRYVGDAANAETATFDYYAWDQTSGTAGTKVDATTRGGFSAFSTANDTASISVTDVNDAPTVSAITPSLTALNINTTGSGETVSDFVGASIGDVDTDASEGIAIYGKTGAGTWEYNTGSGWTSFGALSGTSALLLRAADQVRYTSTGSGETATFDYYAWDRTSGTVGTKVDVSTRGDATAFSSTGDTADIFVNSAPTNMALSANAVLENADMGPSAFTVGTLSTTDADGGDTHTYSIVGGTDSASFTISGDGLQFTQGTVLDYETQSSYEVTVRTTDDAGATYDETFTINVTDVTDVSGTWTGTTGADSVIASTSADTLTGGFNGDTIHANAGTDTIYVDGQNFTNSTVSNMLLWLDGSDVNADGSIVSNGSTVNSWQDKSGNNFDATSGSGPTYSSGVSSLNNRGALTFDGSDVMSIAYNSAFNLTASFTFIAVVETDSISSDATLFSKDGDRNGYGFGQDGSSGEYASWDHPKDSFATTSSGYWSASAYAIKVMQVDASNNVSFYDDGSLFETVSGAAPTTSTADLFIGSVDGGTGGQSNPWSGDVAELMLFDADLSSANRGTIEQYLANKYGVDIGLTFGADTLTGGTGADVFSWGNNAYSNSSNRDAITDFNMSGGSYSAAEGDKVELNFDQQVTINTSGTFSGSAYELIWYQSGNDTIVAMDYNGDGSGTSNSDFEIQLNNFDVSNLSSADFIFNRVVGSSGNDTLTIDANNSDASVDGAAGTDLLIFNGSGVALASASLDTITNVERMDIDGSGNNTLTLTQSDVLNVTDSNNDLYVEGSAGDTANLQTDWSAGSTGVSAFGNTYDQYTNGSATVYVDQELTTNLT